LDGGSEVQFAFVEPTSIAVIAKALGAWYPNRAPRVGVLGDMVRLPVSSIVGSRSGSQAAATLNVVIGLSQRNLEPVSIDLSDGNLLVAGPLRSGRSTALTRLASSLRGVHRVLIAPRPAPGSPGHSDDGGLAAMGGQAGTMSEGSPFEESLVGWDIAERLRTLVESLLTSRRPTIVFIDDLTDFNDPRIDELLGMLVRRARDSCVRVVGAVESSLARTSYGGAVAELRRDRRGLLLQPDVELDGDMVGVRLGRPPRKPFPVGRGVLAIRGETEMLQVALDAVARDPD
jgi:S-DNA-T family DNA segregation ATPase FtsK/SpoIIIE